VNSVISANKDKHGKLHVSFENGKTVSFPPKIFTSDEKIDTVFLRSFLIFNDIFTESDFKQGSGFLLKIVAGIKRKLREKGEK